MVWCKASQFERWLHACLLERFKKTKAMIITRKIQIRVNAEGEEMQKQWESIYNWSYIVRKAANLISSHLFTQDNIKDLFYLEDGTKKKLANIAKDEDGILNTSAQNTTYQLLSKHFKGQIPMDVMSCLNQSISKTYKEERSEYYKGDRSLRSYRKDIPIPFSATSLKWESDYCFSLFKMPLQFVFGRDRSNNKGMADRILSGEYKLCSSSIQIKGRKTFMLMCIDIPKKEFALKADKSINAFLSIANPIVAHVGENIFEIGNKEEFLYRRLQIQAALRRAQINARYSKGGKGRARKMQSIERFSEKEINYVTTRIHTYTRILVDLAVKHQCSVINLVNQKQKESDAKDDEEFLLRNWSYYGMKEKLKYKAGMAGIVIKEIEI